MTGDLEVRFYAPGRFDERRPRPQPGSKRVIQLCQQLKEQKRIVKVSEIIDHSEAQGPEGDGLWSDISSRRRENPILEAFASDCLTAAIADEEKYGVVHMGWKSFCDGFFHKYLENFDPEKRKIIVAPFLHRFEIQKNWAHKKICETLGEEFIAEGYFRGIDLYSFEFLRAVEAALKEEKVFISPESTDKCAYLHSARSGKFCPGSQILRVGPMKAFYAEDNPTEILPWPE